MRGKRIDPGAPAHRQSPTNAPPAKGRPAPSAAAEGGVRRDRRRRRIYRIAVTVLAVILALLVGFTAWWKLAFTQKPQVTPPSQPTQGAEEITDIGPPVRDSGERKQDFYTFLVIGRDTGGGGNTDTILLAGYDIKNQKLSVMSIPRDTMVNVSWEIKKINSVYNVYGGGDRGIEALDKEISQLVGFIPDFQVVLEWKAVGQLVEALGGVYFDIPQNMNYRDPTQDLVISLKKGPQTVDGDKAMQLVRFRSYPNGDLGRVAVQQDFLKAVIRQCLQIGNIARITELSKVFNENVKTNLTVGNIGWFGEKAVFGGLKEANVHFFTMPCSGASVYSPSFRNYQSYVVPKTQELVDLVNQYFNPYIEDLRPHELDIMYVNSNGTIGSSTGKLEDPRANQITRPVQLEETPTPPKGEPSVQTPPAGSGDNGGTPVTPPLQEELPEEIPPDGDETVPPAPDPQPPAPDPQPTPDPQPPQAPSAPEEAAA